MVSSVNKGKNAERDVARRMNAVLDRVCADLGVDRIVLRRNIKATQVGGHDLEGLDWLSIEIKHCNTLALPAWWRQAERQAGTDRRPVLIYKKTGGNWRVRMFAMIQAQGAQANALIDILLDDWLVWFEGACVLELLHLKHTAVSFPVDTEGLFPHCPDIASVSPVAEATESPKAHPAPWEL